MEVASVDNAVISNRRRNVKVLDFLASDVTNDVPQATVVHALGTVFWIPDEFIDEIAQVEHESQTIGLGGALVLENHSAIGILRSLGCILATHEGKSHRPRIIVGRRRDGSSQAASISVKVAEPIPVDMRRFQPTDKYAARPIRGFQDRRLCGRDDAGKGLVFGNFYVQLAYG